MAKLSSIIRYKFKADRDFESVQFEGMSCSLGELKRLILDKSSRTGTHHPKDDYDLTIKDETNGKEYKDYNEQIQRNTSVIVTRRIRGSFESLTTSSYQKPVDATNEIVNKYLRPVVLPTDSPHESNFNADATDEVSEAERIKKLVEDSKLKYLPGQRANVATTCHNCRQTGHMRNQCPLILQQNHVNGTTSSVPPPPSRIITTQAPYHMSNHYHHHHHQPHPYRHRFPRADLRPKNPTGLPKNDLIQIPRHIPGAFRDQTGASVVPIGVARMLIEDSQKKADALAQRTRNQIEETKINETENPPDDLLCPICKGIFRDAVITPCCHQNFCDECIRNALLESDDLQCPRCHRQSVAIDEINPHLLLRKHVDRWRDEQQHKKLTFSYATMPNQTSASATLDERNSNAGDFGLSEFDFHSSMPQQQSTALVSIPTGPIVIKMHASTQSVSPPIVNTQPADVAFEDEKAPEIEQMTNSDTKDPNVEKSPKNDENSLTINDILSSVNSSETEKSSRQTPPSQVAPVSTFGSSPPRAIATTIPGASSLVPHHPYFPSQAIPSAAVAAGLYPMASNFYGSPIHLPYPGVPHHQLIAPPSMLPVAGPPGLIPHYTGYPPYPGMAPTHHSMALTHHLPPNPLNGYHLSPYDTTNVTDFHHSATSTSTLISHQHHHHESVAPLSQDEFYLKQRDYRRNQRSRSYSSSSASSGSNGSRRRRHRHHSDRYRRSSRSRTAQRHRQREDRDRHRSRHRSPSSHSARRRDPPPSKTERAPSKQRRNSPQVSRSTRDRERRRSPRPPPTIQQSTQRTIVYSHESSTKTSSGRDDRQAPSSNSEQQSQSETVRPTSPMIVPSDQPPSTLASTIQTVHDDTYSDKTDKRKKHRHDRSESSHSRSKKHRSSEDRPIKSTTIDDHSTPPLRH